MRSFVILTMAATLSGCAAQLQQQRQAECQQQLASTIAEITRVVGGNRGIDPIRDKINLLEPKSPTLAQLALNSVSSEPEKKALEEWQGTLQTLRPKIDALVQQCSPWETPLLDAARAAGMSNLVDLYTGKIAYGQYNRQRMDISVRLTQASEARRDELQRQQMQAASVAAQQSVAASAAISTFQNYLIGQQLLNQQMQPARLVPFTCTRFGNTTNCY